MELNRVYLLTLCFYSFTCPFTGLCETYEGVQLDVLLVSRDCHSQLNFCKFWLLNFVLVAFYWDTWYFASLDYSFLVGLVMGRANDT